MSNDTYEEIADRSWEDIPVEKTLPSGSWLLRGRNATYRDPKDEDGSPTVTFVHAVKEPMDDVDDGELKGLGEGYDFGQNRIFTTFWLETGKDYAKVRDFLAKHGIIVDPKKSVKESLGPFKGSEVVAILGAQSYRDKAGEEQEKNVASSFTKLEG